MATPSLYPFLAFNFSVEINVPLISKQICSAAFSDCDGLDMTMDVKTVREGGNNTQQIRMIGAVNYGVATFKRGMTSNFDLWDWFDAQQHANPDQLRTDARGDASVVIFAPDHTTKLVSFVLKKCLITKLKAPTLNAKDGMVAIEEMQLAYESLSLQRPQGGA